MESNFAPTKSAAKLFFTGATISPCSPLCSRMLSRMCSSGERLQRLEELHVVFELTLLLR